jgi:Ca2+-binding RTX toxin-like protein
MANFETMSVFAQNVVAYFDSGTGPIPGPYGVVNNVGQARVSEDIVLGEYDGDALSLPEDSFVTVGFGNYFVIDGTGADIELQQFNSARETAIIQFTAQVISEDGGRESINFNRTFTLPRGNSTILIDLADLAPDNSETDLILVDNIKITGQDNGGTSPGFEVYGVRAINAVNENFADNFSEPLTIGIEFPTIPDIDNPNSEEVIDFLEYLLGLAGTLGSGGFAEGLKPALGELGLSLVDTFPGLIGTLAIGFEGVGLAREALSNLPFINGVIGQSLQDFQNNQNQSTETPNPFIGPLDLERQNIEQNIMEGSPANDQFSGMALEVEVDDYFFGDSGDDILEGNSGYDVLIGDVGNDELIGGDGSDVLDGSLATAYNNNVTNFVVGEVDTLTGGTGIDYFVLADSVQNHYDDQNAATSGTEDYALISDFNVEEDFIVLHENFSNYIFETTEDGISIFLDNDGQTGLSSTDELIAQVQGVTEISPIDLIFT